jgi:hypothetical protein
MRLNEQIVSGSAWIGLSLDENVIMDVPTAVRACQN